MSTSDSDGEDDLAAIDTSNIVSGERRSKKRVDYAKAAAESKDLDDDSEDEDDEFVPKEDKDEKSN
jgi:hypothetical protein